jgi:hypothetical protein
MYMYQYNAENLKTIRTKNFSVAYGSSGLSLPKVCFAMHILIVHVGISDLHDLLSY